VEDLRIFLTGGFLCIFFFYVLYSTLLHLPPLSSTVSEDAGIEPRTVRSVRLLDPIHF
jgi:hypothetical protein